MRNKYHIADILERYLPQYQQQHRLTERQRVSCLHIQACRTAALGQQQWQCNQCEHGEMHYCSCRDRHCPRCQGKQSQEWVEKQQQQVINSKYFHLVFTLPHELNVMTHYAPKALYGSLFKAVWETLSTFSHNRNKLHGQLGVTAVLHTWGQSLSQHIHLHCLVPGGVLTEQDKWQGVKTNYLFPVKALSTVFRAKMMARLRMEKVNIPEHETIMSKPWCVYSKACFSKPETVIKYLAQYTKKGMLNEARLKAVNENGVTFQYKDYKQDSQTKVVTLTGVEFIRRYLSHVLPKGFMRIRHYGYLANRSRKQKVALIKKQTAIGKVGDKKPTIKAEPRCWHCPKCAKGILQLTGLNVTINAYKRKRNELISTG